MSTSTLRVLIVVAALALGVVFLREAFPGTSKTAVKRPPKAPITTLPSESPTPPPSESPSPTPSEKPKPKPKVKGVVVQVLNGTHTNGLAGEISTRLEAAGYTLKTAANYGTTQTTTIYYQPGQKINAAYLQKKQFPDAALAPALKSQPKDVDITVVLGLDFSP